MNKLTFVVAAIMVSDILCAANAKKARSLEEQHAFRASVRSKIAARTGGMISRPHTSGSKFVFINDQSLVKEQNIADPVETLVRVLSHDISLESKKANETFSIANVPLLMKKQQAKGAIFLIEDDILPTILTAPEAGWGVINVRKLNADNPDTLILAQRVRREMWRVFAMVNGGGNTRMGKCVMQTVLSLADIDALGAEAFCPEPVNAIVSHLNSLGIKEYQMTTYKKACEEGWAPPPTNDIQKAIWEKAKAEANTKPSNPLLITKPKK